MIFLPPPPPPALSDEEFKRRWRPGMTYDELHPEMAAWEKRSNQHSDFFFGSLIVVGIVLALLFAAAMIRVIITGTGLF